MNVDKENEKQELEREIYERYGNKLKTLGYRVIIEQIGELPQGKLLEPLGKIRGKFVYLLKYSFKVVTIYVLIMGSLPQAVKNHKIYFPTSYELISKIGRDIQNIDYYALQNENSEKEVLPSTPNSKFSIYTNNFLNNKHHSDEYDIESIYSFRQGTIVGSTSAPLYVGEAHLTTMHKYSKADK